MVMMTMVILLILMSQNTNLRRRSHEILDDIPNSVCRGTPALKAVQNLCTKYNVKKYPSWINAQATVEDGVSPVSLVVYFKNEIVKKKETSLTHRMVHETRVAPLNDLASQGILLQRKTADTLANASGAAASLAASLKRACEEVRKASMQHD